MLSERSCAFLLCDFSYLKHSEQANLQMGVAWQMCGVGDRVDEHRLSFGAIRILYCRLW